MSEQNNTKPVTQQVTDDINAALGVDKDGKSTVNYETPASNTDQYTKILQASFDKGNGTDNIVDIITKYWWTTNKPKEQQNGQQQIANVPFLYAIEYKQRYGVTLTNLLNNTYALLRGGGSIGTSVVQGIGGLLDRTAEVLSKAIDSYAGNTISSAVSTGVKAVNSAMTNLEKFANKGQKAMNSMLAGDYIGNYLDTDLLLPYSSLYALETTNKKFCFPFFGDNASGWNISNSFSAEGSTSILSKSITEGMGKLANGVVAIAGDLQEFGNFFSRTPKTFTMYNIEKAKAFSFPTDGKKVTVKFPLFNTIEKDSWKHNYRFILLFGLRNMLFRLNNVQYYPPLIYDVSIPGWGRMPLSYVSSFTVRPVGMTRVKSINVNFINPTGETKESSVIVPEAWIVSIEFQSLIADSANQVLSSIFDLPIQADVVQHTPFNDIVNALDSTSSSS